MRSYIISYILGEETSEESTTIAPPPSPSAKNDEPDEPSTTNEIADAVFVAASPSQTRAEGGEQKSSGSIVTFTGIVEEMKAFQKDGKLKPVPPELVNSGSPSSTTLAESEAWKELLERRQKLLSLAPSVTISVPDDVEVSVTESPSEDLVKRVEEQDKIIQKLSDDLDEFTDKFAKLQEIIDQLKDALEWQ